MLTPPLIPTQLWDSGAIQDYFGLIVIIWHAFFLSSFCSLFFSVFYSSLCSFFVFRLVAGCQPVRKMRLQSIRAPQGGLQTQGPRSLIAPGQADLPAGRATATHVHRASGTDMLPGLLCMWLTLRDRQRPAQTELRGPYGEASGSNTVNVCMIFDML